MAYLDAFLAASVSFTAEEPATTFDSSGAHAPLPPR